MNEDKKIEDMSKSEALNLIENMLLETINEDNKTRPTYDSAFNFALKKINKYTEYKVDKLPQEEDYGVTHDDIIADEIKRQRKVNENKYGRILSCIVILGLITNYFFQQTGSIFSGLIIGVFSYPLYVSFIIFILFRDYESAVQDAFTRYITDCIAYYNWQQKLKKDFWLCLSGHQFETELAKVYRSNGYNSIVTKGSGDKGVDIILEKDSDKILVQCKAHKKAVGPAVARELFGAMNSFGIKKGIIASLSGFTKGVYEFVKDKEIELISIDEILNMTK